MKIFSFDIYTLDGLPPVFMLLELYTEKESVDKFLGINATFLGDIMLMPLVCECADSDDDDDDAVMGIFIASTSFATPPSRVLENVE